MESASPDSVDDVDDIKDLLTCSLCSKTLNESRTLPCFHNFCRVCLGKYVDRLRRGDKTIETFPCPTCSSEFELGSKQDVGRLSSSCFINNMLDIMAVQEKAKDTTSCSRCHDSANDEVDELYGEVHSDLRKQHEEIKQYLDKMQASMSFPRNLLKRGSVEEILSSQKMINERIEQLEIEKPKNLNAVNDGGIQYVPDDIRKINVNEIVDNLGYVKGGVSKSTCKLKRSSILKGEIAFIKQLQLWLGEKCKWNLCYRASRDGWSGHGFHRHCDNKGPTVVLVKANDCIFGGYTDQQWGSIKKGNWDTKRSYSSFLFSLRNKDNLAPFIANIKQGQEHKAIYSSSGFGPRCGGGHDFCISDSPQASKLSYSNFGYTYQLPPGYVCGSEQAKNLLAGQHQFSTTEIEVFI